MEIRKTSKQIKQSAFVPNGAEFIGRYQKLIKNKVIPYQYDILNDDVEGAEKSHVIANFANAGKTLRGIDNDGFYGMVFQDSDAGKWIEAVAYSLTLFPDEELEKVADDFIDIIADAQDEDGYLNTYFTIKDKDKRFTNLQEGHELYSSGHLMEAACAYYEATGKDKLLKVMQKNAECIYKHFVTEGVEGYPGHPEIELALLKMYRITGDDRCRELASHFIDVRGVDPSYYKKEFDRRNWTVWGNDPGNPAYNQAHEPVREQKDAVGHAVRAVYLYTAMADMASISGDERLYEACRKLWDSIVSKRMYVTGGIGSTVLGEAFTVDYNLPSDTAYCETCASIGLMFFAQRMLEIDCDRRYSDVMERAFYNTVLAGMQLDGEKFFYVNPLEVIPGISGTAVTHKHDLPVRPSWYACACCPPNVARLISSFGKYAYHENENTSFVHLYAAGEVRFENGMAIDVDTKYPYDFNVDINVTEGKGTLAIRLPGWSRNTRVLLNGIRVGESSYNKGYAYIEVKKGDYVSVLFDEEPFYVYPLGQIANLTDMVCVQRGPLVYCFEGVDNCGDVVSLRLDDTVPAKVHDYDSGLLSGTVMLSLDGYREETECEDLYSRIRPERKSVVLKAVPYYTWGNRGENQMRVWMGR